MAWVRATRDAFLWCMSIMYLFAFSSFYVQIPGLFGDNGILPARVIELKGASSFADILQGKPTLLRLMPYLGISTEKGMELLCIAGIILSFLCMTMKFFMKSVEYGFLWLLYLSLYEVGQTFFHFQWDILLLEAGFLCIIIAPLNMNLVIWKTARYHHHDNIALFLVKWLLFRLMFASGVVKLTSMCPTWWGLTALEYHFESQCIPTPLAWYAHHLPSWLLHLGVTATFLIEILVPFLFFAPIKHLRRFAFYSQVLLQIGIILTGNYNFFNLLTITLCVSLLDDDFFQKRKPRHVKKKILWYRVTDWVLIAAAYGFIIYILVKYFSLSFGPDYKTLITKIAFTQYEFTEWLAKVVPYTILVGAISLGIEVLVSLIRCWQTEKGLFRRLTSSFGVCVMAGVASFMFVISLVPYTRIDTKMQQSLPRDLLLSYKETIPFQLSHSYGLFRRFRSPTLVSRSLTTCGLKSSKCTLPLHHCILLRLTVLCKAFELYDYSIIYPIFLFFTTTGSAISNYISVFRHNKSNMEEIWKLTKVPYTVLDVKSNTNLRPEIKTLYKSVDNLHLTSSYGLFRVMTGVGGRPEVIIEGSTDMKDWKEYHFLYKPGNLTKSPVFVAPHQPRLDWQMWFAALGNYQHNPWLLTFCYRLLTGQPEVLELIQHNPFPDTPPKYLRAKLYHYHFTSPKQMSVKYSKDNWWTREPVSEYLPVLVKNDQGLKEWLQENGIFQPIKKDAPPNLLAKLLIKLREYIGQPDGFTFIMSIFSTGLTINYMTKYLS